MTGLLEGIAVRAGKRMPMQTLRQADVSCEFGVANDYRGRPGKRQVTVLTLAAWQAACDELGCDLAWTSRRANLLVSGIQLDETAGRYLSIGECLLEITRETDPCSRMDEVEPGLKEALANDWRGGVCCRVIEPGRIAIGDAASLVS